MDIEEWSELAKTAGALAPVATALIGRNSESEKHHTDAEKNRTGDGEDQEKRIEELERSMAYCYRIIQRLIELNESTMDNLQILKKKHGANRRRIKAIGNKRI